MNNKSIKETIRPNRLGLLFMIAAAFLVALGQLCWKLSAGSYTSLLLYFGFALYFAGAILMIISLHFGKLSVVHPVLSTSYLFGLVLSGIFLDEKIAWSQYLGIIVIVAGVALIGAGDKE